MKVIVAYAIVFAGVAGFYLCLTLFTPVVGWLVGAGCLGVTWAIWFRIMRRGRST
jgi:hypothetical protein